MTRPPSTDSATASFPWSRGTWAILIVAALLRIVLITRGGQYGQIDEFRYQDSQVAAGMVAQGQWLKGLVYPLEKGDHVGFKELGLIPALIEHRCGGSPLIAALFFGTFSWVAILLLGGVGYHFSGSRRVQFWTVAFAAGSGAWFYFARHLLPYDAALCLVVAGLYFASGPRWRWWALPLAGALAGGGFVTYYGYWTLTGLVLVLATVCGTKRPAHGYFVNVLLRGSLLFAGFALAVALPVLANHCWGTGRLVAGARDLSGSIITGDFRGHLVPWIYLWYTDRVELVLALAALILGAALARRGPRDWQWPIAANLAAFVALYLSFVVTGTLLHKFVVHDRLVRQLLPFLMLGAGFGVELLTRSLRADLRSRFGWLLGGILLGNAAFAFATPLAQEFPQDFARRAEAILAQRTDPVSPDSYFRYVNVLRFFFEGEVLKTPPLETLLAAPHFFQYRPYLFESKTPEDRARREAIDYRMRLVKMAVAPNARILGDRYGAVAITFRTGVHRGGFLEPLLSLGARGQGDIFYLRYFTDSEVAFGFFSSGKTVFEGRHLTFAPGSVHTVQFASGDLLGPEQAQRLDYVDWHAIAKVDGAKVMDGICEPRVVNPNQIYAGVSAIFDSYVETEFAGEILAVQRDAAALDSFEEKSSYRAHADRVESLHLHLQFDPTYVALAMPLLSYGRTGQAVITYIRMVDANFVRVGCDVWGAGNTESKPLALNPDRTLDLELVEGPLLPDPASPAWGKTAVAQRLAGKRRISVRSGGHEVFGMDAPPWSVSSSEAHVAANPIGGSLVSDKFANGTETHSWVPLGE